MKQDLHKNDKSTKMLKNKPLFDSKFQHKISHNKLRAKKCNKNLIKVLLTLSASEFQLYARQGKNIHCKT